MKAVLEVEDLQAFYGATRILEGIGLRLGEGEVVALLGANGAGKTTTLRALSRLVRTAGTVRIMGKDTGSMAPQDIARLGVAHVPDGRGTFMELTVRENLVLGDHLRRSRRPLAEDIERVCGYFPVLARMLGRQAGTLSGGEQQMLAIARALMMQPRILLLDEPSFGLAPRVVREVFGVLERIRRHEAVAVLLVEQNSHLALQLADRAYLIETGRVVLEGSAGDLAADDAVRRAYLGA